MTARPIGLCAAAAATVVSAQSAGESLTEDAGGGGGGGRILVDSDLYATTGRNSVLITGGAGGTSVVNPFFDGSPGDYGSFATTGYVLPVPEPASLAAAAVGGYAIVRSRRPGRA